MGASLFPSEKKYWALLFLVIFPFYLTWTFDHSLWNPDETRDGGIAREMWDTKDFVVPHLNGEAFLEKPPLYYWSCSTVYALTGRVTAGTTRLPAALYGFLGCLFTFLLGKKLWNARAGFVAAALLATSVQYFRMSHMALMDSSLAAFITGALAFFFIGQNLLFLLFTVLAFYTKGFVALALIGVVVGPSLVLSRAWKRLVLLSLVGAVFLALAILPWAYGLWKSGGQEYLRTFFIDNNWNRFFAAHVDHKSPFYFYLGSFPLDFLPWTPFFVAALVYFYRHSQVFSGEGESKQGARRGLFPFLWFGAMFLFLSLSSSKRSMYLLPAMPAAALICAGWLEYVTPRYEKLSRITLAATIFLLVLGDIFAMRPLEKDKSFLPVINAAQQNLNGGTLIGFDMSEMERGVFYFYFGRNIPNILTPEELAAFLDTHRGKRILLLTNRNKMKELSPLVDERMRLLFRYRPDAKTRSYLLYELEKMG